MASKVEETRFWESRGAWHRLQLLIFFAWNKWTDGKRGAAVRDTSDNVSAPGDRLPPPSSPVPLSSRRRFCVQHQESDRSPVDKLIFTSSSRGLFHALQQKLEMLTQPFRRTNATLLFVLRKLIINSRISRPALEKKIPKTSTEP